MLAVRILIGLLIAYLVLLGLAWAFQDRLAFPAPREAPPDPAQVRPLRVEQLTLVMHDHTPLVAWYFHPAAPAPRRPASSACALPHAHADLPVLHSAIAEHPYRVR